MRAEWSGTGAVATYPSGSTQTRSGVRETAKKSSAGSIAEHGRSSGAQHAGRHDAAGCQQWAMAAGDSPSETAIRPRDSTKKPWQRRGGWGGGPGDEMGWRRRGRLAQALYGYDKAARQSTLVSTAQDKDVMICRGGVCCLADLQSCVLGARVACGEAKPSTTSGGRRRAKGHAARK